jgi:proteic killer suppression protein
MKLFKDKRTEALYNDETVKGVHPHLAEAARIRLQYVVSADSLNDLLIPPSNQLERLKGDRKGQWSIRVNKQWRLCFMWDGTQASSIELIDYHEETTP